MSDADPAAGYEACVLGPFEVRRDGVALELGGPQQRAVLALLLLEAGRVVPVDRIIARLWGEEPPASALGTLQSYVSRLRRALEPARGAGRAPRLLVSEAPGYVVRIPAGQVDAFRFAALAAQGRTAAAGGRPDAAVEHFDAALALWRGPALAGLGGESWLEPIVARLDDERLAAVEDRFDALLALSRHGEAVGALQESVAEHPLRERLWGQLALALYRSRRQGDALRVLAQARRTLAEELGLDPGPDLRRLEEQILAQDPALVATPPPPARPAALAPPAPPPAAPALVGRRREQETLAGVLREAGGGHVAVAVVEGEAGIGKTVLVQALADSAVASGWQVVRGRCVEEGLAPALWPWLEVVRALLEAAGAVPDAARWPSLRALASGEDGGGGATLVEVAGEVAELLGHAAAGAPHLVVLDDLHWADTASLELLPLVTSRLAGARVAVAVTHRPLDYGSASPLATALGSITRLPGTLRLALRGLDDAGVAALLATASGEEPDAATVAAVTSRTGGNPLFVAELARLAGARPGAADPGGGAGSAAAIPPDAVPDAVRDVVRRRLARLPEPTLTLLHSAAVLGQDVDLRVLGAAAGLDLDDCLDTLDPAVVTRVLVPEGAGGLRFGHALVRDAVLADLSPLRRARLHRRAADALERVFGADRDHAEPIAVHRWEAAAVDDPLAVARALVLAGDVARRRGALDRAEELLELALAAARRIPAGPQRVGVEVDAMESVLSVETLRSFMADRHEAIADRIDEIATRNASDEARALALFTRWGEINNGHLRDVERHARAAGELGRRSGSPYARVLAHYMQGVQAWMAGQVEVACAEFDTALDVQRAGTEDGAPLPPINVPGVGAIVFATGGRLTRARECLDQLDAWARGRGEDRSVPVDVAFFTGMAAAVRMDAAATRAATAPVAEQAAMPFLPHFTPACRVLHGWAVAALGDASAGAAEAVAGVVDLDAGANRIAVPMLRSLAADALLRVGDVDGAGAALARAAEEARAMGEVWWLPATLALAAVVADAAGDAARAATLRGEAREAALAQGRPAAADEVLDMRRTGETTSPTGPA